MFSKNKGLAKTNSKELLLNKSGVNSGGKGTEREESMAGKERLMAIRQTIQMQKKASVGELSKICRVRSGMKAFKKKEFIFIGG